MLRVVTVQKFAAEARIVKARAHPTRLRAVDTPLHHREQWVCELARAAGIDMPTVITELNH